MSRKNNWVHISIYQWINDHILSNTTNFVFSYDAKIEKLIDLILAHHCFMHFIFRFINIHIVEYMKH